MSNNKSDFKVFVSDEILNFRTLEEKYNKASLSNLARTPSYNAIDINKCKKETPIITERPITSFEKFAKTLYSSTPVVPYRFKKPPQKSRSKTVDPRFRRPRSLTYRLTASQSSAELTNSSMLHSQAKKKSHSASYLSPSKNCNCEQVHKNKQEQTDTFVTTRYDNTKQEQEKCDKSSLNNLNILSTNPSEVPRNENLLNELDSLDKMEYRDNEKQISPYWDDPRLVEKHNIVMKPIQTRPSMSAVTVPILQKPLPRGVVCRNCIRSQGNTPTYKYDDRTEICNCSLISNEPSVNKFYNEAGDYISFATLMALGSLLGILITSCIAWLICWFCSWDLSKFWLGRAAAPPPPDEGVMFYIKYFSASILYSIDVLFNAIYEILLIPRADILNYNNGREQENLPWWSNIF